MSEQRHPLETPEVSDRGKRALDRLKEIFAVDELPEGFSLLAGSENAINDLYMNLNRQLADGKVERREKLLLAVAVASAAGSPDAVEFFSRAALAAGRTQTELLEAIGVAGTCTVFNGHYRFRHHVAEDDKATFEAFRAPFNANVFVKPQLPISELEAICIAVSSANGCYSCVQGHVAKAKAVGVTNDQIDEIIRASAASLSAANIAAALGRMAAAQSTAVA